MSTRQRFTHETTTEPGAGAALLLARGVDSGTPPFEDIAARRLRVLAERVSNTAMPAPGVDDDGKLDEADAEFEPVSLEAILALGREQTPDAPGDALTASTETAGAVVPFAAIMSAPSLPAPANDEVAPTTALAMLSAEAPAEPLQLAAEVLEAPGDIGTSPPTEEAPPETTGEDDAPPAADQPLMLADQSATDIRLVDLIRRQQSLLDQLNHFPPSYETLRDAANEVAGPQAVETPPRSVVEQLAPPLPLASARAPTEIAQEAPPPLPPPEKTALPPPRLPRPAARENRDEPSEAELPQQSPMIIQRARAERFGRRNGPAVAAPPSAVPAFLGGVAVALVVAGVLFAVL